LNTERHKVFFICPNSVKMAANETVQCIEISCRALMLSCRVMCHYVLQEKSTVIAQKS